MNRLKEEIIIMFMALCPIAYLSASDTRLYQEQFFQMFSMTVIAVFIENIWLSAFIFLNIFLFLYNGAEVGVDQIMNVLFGCLLFSICRNYFRKNKFIPVARILLWVLILDIIWMVFQTLRMDPIFMGMSAQGVKLFGRSFSDPVGFFYIKMANGIFISLCLPILASINVYLALFLIPVIALSQASAAILACYVSTLFYTFYTKRKLFIILSIVGTILSGIFIYNDQHNDPSTFKSRFPLWHAMTRYSLMNPIGYGPDSFRKLNRHKNFLFFADYNYNLETATQLDKDKFNFSYYSISGDTIRAPEIKENNINFWDNPHNEYMGLLFEYGVGGIIILIGLLREMVLRFKESTKDEELVLITSVLLVFAISSFAHFPLHLARLGCLFPIFLGAFYARTDKRELYA